MDFSNFFGSIWVQLTSLILFATIHGYVNSAAFPLTDVVEIAFLASARDTKNLPALTKALKSPHPVIRYWGALGCVALGKSAAAATDALTPLLTDEAAANRITAAHALFVLGQSERGKAVLVAELDKPSTEYAQQLLVNTITRLNLDEAIPASWVERILKDDNANEYLKRLANRLSGEAKPIAKNKKKKNKS